MELKSFKDCTFVNCIELSIVPSWNWNEFRFKTTFVQDYYQSYHRGIEMCNIMLTEKRPYSINRTIVELKYVQRTRFTRLTIAINRTIVELKCYESAGDNKNLHLSIVPSWNWNEIRWIQFCTFPVYQSYHRGIEMCADVLTVDCWLLSIVPSWNWN